VVCAALAVVALAVSCASAPRVGPTTLPPQPNAETEAPPVVIEIPVPQSEPQPDLDSLYAKLDEGRALYQEGLEMIVAGEEVAGEERLAEATEALASAADECNRTDGCEMTRFTRALDDLLARQSINMKRQASRIRELESAIQAEETEREPGTTPFMAEMPEIDRTVSLLRGTDLRDIIALNGPVKAALDDWLTWLRPNLMTAYRNYQFLRTDIAPVYEEAGFPEALLFAIIATESGGKVHAYSRAGAAGPLQFMRRTGMLYGLRVEDGFDLRLDPVAATRASLAYLNERLAELNNSLEKALAAYNGGENRLRGLHRRFDGASLWDKRVYYSLPRETREYVPRVLAAAWLFLHPEDYNLEWPEVPTARATLTVREEIALGELTICLGQERNPDGWFRTLRNLNPRLEPGDRIEAGQEIVVPSLLVPIYEERCTGGQVLARARELHDANYAERDEFVPYFVRRGDTLGKIASRFRCVGVRELAAINNIRPPRYVIRVGQQLKVPTCN
jgi:membrane-bound lytic murein transglycosylase D